MDLTIGGKWYALAAACLVTGCSLLNEPKVGGDDHVQVDAPPAGCSEGATVAILDGPNLPEMRVSVVGQANGGFLVAALGTSDLFKVFRVAADGTSTLAADLMDAPGTGSIFAWLALTATSSGAVTCWRADATSYCQNLTSNGAASGTATQLTSSVGPVFVKDIAFSAGQLLVTFTSTNGLWVATMDDAFQLATPTQIFTTNTSADTNLHVTPTSDGFAVVGLDAGSSADLYLQLVDAGASPSGSEEILAQVNSSIGPFFAIGSASSKLAIAVPGRLFLRDDTGTVVDVTTGGGQPSLARLGDTWAVSAYNSVYFVGDDGTQTHPTIDNADVSDTSSIAVDGQQQAIVVHSHYRQSLTASSMECP